MGPCKKTGLAPVVLYDELAQPIGVVGNPLEVNGTLTVTPGVAVQGQQVQAPFNNVTPVGFTVTPAIDYDFEYVTMRFTGLTAGATITVNVTYGFAVGAFNTLVKTATFVADGAGVADFFYSCKTFRSGLSSIVVTATTTSVAGGGAARTTVQTTQ